MLRAVATPLAAAISACSTSGEFQSMPNSGGLWYTSSSRGSGSDAR